MDLAGGARAGRDWGTCALEREEGLVDRVLLAGWDGVVKALRVREGIRRRRARAGRNCVRRRAQAGRNWVRRLVGLGCSQRQLIKK